MLPHVVQMHVLRRPAVAMPSAARATPSTSAPANASASRARAARATFAAQLAALRRGFGSTARAAQTATTSALRRAARTGQAATRADTSSHALDGTTAAIDDWLRTPRQRALAEAITRASGHVGIEPSLSLAVAVAESSLNPSARSADGLSSGTFQVTAPTAADVRRRFATRELERPPGGDDIALGVAHLRWLDDLFARDATLGGALRTVPVDDPAERARFAVAAYNAGEGRVARAQQQAAQQRRDPTRYESIRPYLPAITQRYVDRVMRYSGRASQTRAV